MSYKINQKEIESVLSLSNVDRFYHCVARAVDWEEIWSLRNESGWATVESEDRTCIPFWPHPSYAKLFAKGDWDGYEASPITLSNFVQDWLPGMQNDDVFLAVFPNLEYEGIIVNAEKVLVAVNEELEKY